jgi:ElaB/YqjD/DUF883 family membrane-anchored ribosome-binding protein
MDDEPEMIRQQMAATRSSLTDKIERLEQSVTQKVETTAAAVTGTVESVKDTVKTMKDTVHDTVDSVKCTVNQSVDAVKDAFDIPGYFREYPWPAFAASVAAGVAGGLMLGSSRDPIGRLRSQGRPLIVAAPAPSTNGADRDQIPQPTNVAVPPAAAEPWWTGEIGTKFGDELAKLKGVALGAAFGLVRHWVNQSARGDIGQMLGEVIDDVTRKLGGLPIRGNPMDSFVRNGGKASRDRDAGTEARAGERATAGADPGL